MTAGEAIKMADELRPNNHFENQLKQLWLRQADSGMRRNIVERSQTGGDFEDKGADILWNDGLEYDTPLLVDRIPPDILAELKRQQRHTVKER